MSHIEQLIQQGITFCVEAGKSILVALLIYIVGRFLVSLLNKLLTKALERRNIDPTIKTFLQSFVNILLTVLLIVAVVSALGINTTSFAALLAFCGRSYHLAAQTLQSGRLRRGSERSWNSGWYPNLPHRAPYRR